MLTDGWTDGRTNIRKLARLCLPAKADATIKGLFSIHKKHNPKNLNPSYMMDYFAILQMVFISDPVLGYSREANFLPYSQMNTENEPKHAVTRET